jgi:hypothetical protein
MRASGVFFQQENSGKILHGPLAILRLGCNAGYFSSWRNCLAFIQVAGSTSRLGGFFRFPDFFQSIRMT